MLNLLNDGSTLEDFKRGGRTSPRRERKSDSERTRRYPIITAI
jgi:hypothetical protein